MKKIYLTIALMFVITITKAQAPVNDDCANAITLVPTTSCISTAGTVANATASGIAACTGTPSDDVWYTFVAVSQSHIVTVVPSSGMDAAIQVFSSTPCGGSGVSINCTNAAGVGSTESTCLIMLVSGQQYWIRVYDFAGAPSTNTFTICIVSNPVTVTVNSPTICAGQTASLTANGASTYVWSTGATPTGVNTADASPMASTSYVVTGTASDGCTGMAISSVTVNPIPVVSCNSPTICLGQTASLAVTGAQTYTWSAGATPTGANTASASPLVSTSYTVTGTALGCSATAVSAVTVIGCGVGINEVSDNTNVTIAPNPFTSQTTITFSEEQKNTTIYIRDVLGRLIVNGEWLIVNEKQKTIDMSGASKGVYFVQITDEKKNVINKKIVVQ